MALILIMLLAGLPFAPRTAYAVTSAEKQAEADEMVRQLDALQTEISRINRELDDATAAQEAASLKMQDAKEREDAAIARTAELQRQLAERAVEAYRNKTPTYLDVLFGASSFSEFISSWDMINRLNVHDTQLTQNSKDIRKEAESARQLYNEQERIIAEKKAEIASLKVEMEEKSAEMQAEIVRLNEEAAELLAQEEAAAEAARLAAAAAAIANGSLTPEQIAALPKFIHPCPSGVFTSGFGYRDFDHSFHMGLDLGAPTGTPIYAVAAGTVIISGYSSSAGNWVVISHGSGLVTKYMHASALYVTAGQSVSAGETIAAVGNTGNSFGAHLHFQVEIGGTAVNPLPFL
ncbi:MAG: peptidoglycan DD-metalloendopeptidase family protein [Coriobacteriales bacterium]|jgi:murein DD-endopeptidase MepM/ murein hydrolase activator NlpD|nr:peptidoglycan DD-metalloendopeptidase family protein [Coriobacteriales bacterium]